MPVHLIAGLRELAPRYDGFILDLWGVIHDGVAPIPGAIDCLRLLIDKGKRIVLLSNAPVGSSARIRAGSFTIARAMTTRCCSPPES